MNHSPKTKVSRVQASLRRAAAVLALRPSYPAWIDAEQGLAFSATVATPRVRDCLVLRLVERPSSHPLGNASYAHGGR
ncbi:MAG: hypothetical protein JWM88_1782 [Verrucomicrobia bacterium]|nr:hypothetical protein [Verrucomicrobiota bacterium]